MASATEPPPPRPDADSRRRAVALIAGFLALQFLVPLTYLSREDLSDERFTWRNLAGADSESACETEVTLELANGQRQGVAVETLVHRDWLAYVSRGRRAVVDAFLRKQCDAGGVLEIALTNRCHEDGEVREFTLRCGGERAYETVRTAAR